MNFLYSLSELRNPFLDVVFQFVTYFGEQIPILLIICAFYWCYNKALAYRIGLAFFASGIVVQNLKITFRISRPWILDPEFIPVPSAIEGASGFSFPSGHSQSAASFWGTIALSFRKRYVAILCTSLFLLVGFSRMYLGVHTPKDVGVSLVIAVILVFALYPIVERAARNPRAMGGLLLVMVGLSVLYLLFTVLYPFPADIDADNLAHGIQSGWKMLGCTVGMTLVWWLDEKLIHFETEAVWYAQIIKVVIGFGLVLAVKSGLKPPLVALLGAGVGGAVRYFLMVLVAGAVWPLFFRYFARMGRR